MAFFFGSGIAAIVGLMVACLALPLKFVRPASSHQTMRKFGIFGCALLAFFAFFVLTAYVDAYLDYVFGLEDTRTHIWSGAEIVGDRYDETLRENKSAVIAELWVRNMIPPGLPRSCYSQNETVCNYADTLTNPPMDWLGSDPLVLMQSLLSAIVSSITFSFFIRQRDS
jgi:hypothetical protein